MNCDKSKRENRKSDSRRSSILKRQDTCRIENFEIDGPRTPRRVSFASTCTVKHFNPLPWHSSSDESSSTNHEGFSLMVDSEEVFQGQHTASFPQPLLNIGHQPEEHGNIFPQTLDEALTDTGHAKETESQPMQNNTIIFGDMNESGCSMETTANISELSSSFGESAPCILEEKQEIIFGPIYHPSVSEVKQPKILDNLFSLIKKSKPVEDLMDISDDVACSKFNLVHTQSLLKSGHRKAFNDISEFDVMTPIEELSLVSTNQSLGEFKKGLSVQPVSSQVCNSNQISLKLDKIEKYIIDKENIIDCDKENYPVLKTLNTSLKTPEVVPQNIKKASTVEVTNSESSHLEHFRITESTVHFEASEGMEITTELSRTVQLGFDVKKTNSQADTLNRDGSRTIHFGLLAEHSEEKDDMELTNILTKTIHGGFTFCTNSSKNVETSNRTVHFGQQQLNNGCDLLQESGDMELTRALAKTIYIGPECNMDPQKSMEITSELSRTEGISLDVQKNINQANTLSRDGSQTIHFGPHAGRSEKNDDMELRNVITKTVHIGFSSCKSSENVETSNRTVHFGQQQLNNGCDLLPESGDMELTSALAKTIYIGPECNMNIQNDCSNTLTKDKENNESDSVRVNKGNTVKEATVYYDEMQLTTGLSKTLHESFETISEYRVNNVMNNTSTIPTVISSNTTNSSNEVMDISAVSAQNDAVDVKPLKETHCVQNLADFYLDQLSNRSLPALSKKLSVDLGEQSIERLLDGEIISKDVRKSAPLDGFIKQEIESTVKESTRLCNLTQTNSLLPVTENTVTDKEGRKKSLLKDLSQQLSLTRALGKRKSTNFDLILGQKCKQSRDNSVPGNNIILNKHVSSSDTQHITSFDVNNSSMGNSRNFGVWSHCESPIKSSQCSILLAKDILSPDQPSERRNGQDGLSPLPEIFCNTPTVAIGAIKCKAIDSLDDFDGAEMINNQEMPQLANIVDDSFSENLSTDELHTTDIKQKLEFHLTEPTSLSDFLDSFGITQTRNDNSKNVSHQHIPMSTTQDKLKALISFVPKVETLKHFLADLQCSSKKIQHECKVKLSEYTNHLPPACNWLAVNKPTVNQQILEMLEASKILALSKWKKHKADYLLKYFAATEAMHDALNSEIQDVLSETESLIKNTSNIDARLHELDMILQDNKEQVKVDNKLEVVERQNVQLRVQCADVNKKIETLQTEIDASQKRSSENVQEATVLKEKLLWMNRFTEWSILKKTDTRLDFGFLWNTLVLHIDYSCPSKQISKVSLTQRLSDSSQPWAQFAHSYAVSSIDCELLHLNYRNLNQLSQLLNEVSLVMLASRRLSSELKIICLRHHLSIDKNSLTIAVLDRATCRKLSMSTCIVPSSYPHVPMNWILTSIFGCTSIFQSVKQVIEGVSGGDGYLTRLLAAVEHSLKE